MSSTFRVYDDKCRLAPPAGVERCCLTKIKNNSDYSCGYCSIFNYTESIYPKGSHADVGHFDIVLVFPQPHP